MMKIFYLLVCVNLVGCSSYMYERGQVPEITPSINSEFCEDISLKDTSFGSGIVKSVVFDENRPVYKQWDENSYRSAFIRFLENAAQFGLNVMEKRLVRGL